MRTFIVLLQKEFIQFKRNSFLPKLVLILPFVLILILPWITTMDVKNVNVIVVDNDCSTTSARIISHISASEYFTYLGTVSNYSFALHQLEQGSTDVIVQIPDNFERDLAVSTPEHISITANAVNATKGSTGMQYVIQTITHTIKELNASKSPVETSELITVQNRFNPTLNYQHYMIPALMIMLFVLVCGFLPALSIVGEKESGTIEQINVTPVNRFTFTIAKLIPYWIIGLFVLTMAMLVAWAVYGLTPSGSIGVIYAGAILFILTITGFSVTIANFSNTMQQTVFVMFFFIMIFMLLSGLLTPIDSMPEWAQYFTIILPPKYLVEIMRSVYLKGTTFIELWPNFLALGIFAIIFNILAAVTYKKQS